MLMAVGKSQHRNQEVQLVVVLATMSDSRRTQVSGLCTEELQAHLWKEK